MIRAAAVPVRGASNRNAGGRLSLEIEGVKLLVDPMSYTLVAGDGRFHPLTHRFQIRQPQCHVPCGCGQSFTM
jgi:Fe-S cluster assembly iron-binding protein IscA